MTKKSIEIYEPTNLAEVNLASGIVYMKVMRIEGLEPIEKIAQLIASMNDLPIEEVKALPIEDLDRIGSNILTLFQDDDRDYKLDDVRIITIKGIKYGLEPNFNKIETGAYIDLTELLKDIEGNLHKIMAILYRPIVKQSGKLYNLSIYSTENQDKIDQRADMMLREMPYGVVRASVNFMSQVIKS